MSYDFLIEMAWKSAAIAGGALASGGDASLARGGGPRRRAQDRGGPAARASGHRLVRPGARDRDSGAGAGRRGRAAPLRRLPRTVAAEPAALRPRRVACAGGNWDDPSLLFFLLYARRRRDGRRPAARRACGPFGAGPAARARSRRPNGASALARAGGDSLGIRLLACEDASSPLSWGLRRPVILLDRDTLRTPEEADAILAHEVAHVARRDWPSLILSRLAVALFWFNPLVWRLDREVAQQAEEAADSDAAATGRAGALRPDPARLGPAERPLRSARQRHRRRRAGPVEAGQGDPRRPGRAPLRLRLGGGGDARLRRLRGPGRGARLRPGGARGSGRRRRPALAPPRSRRSRRCAPASAPAPLAAGRRSPLAPPASHRLRRRRRCRRWRSRAPAPAAAAPLAAPRRWPRRCGPGARASARASDSRLMSTKRRSRPRSRRAVAEAIAVGRASPPRPAGPPASAARGGGGGHDARRRRHGGRRARHGSAAPSGCAREAGQAQEQQAYREDVIRRNAARGEHVTHEELLEAAEEMADGAREMREGAREMREAAADMRRGRHD